MPARRNLGQLPLEAQRGSQVPFLLRQRRELLQERDIRRALGEQPLQLAPGGAEIAGGLVGLGNTEGEHPPIFRNTVPVAPEALQPLEQAVELVGRQVEGQPVRS